MRHFFPLQLLLATFAGWVNREQAQVVAYLVGENRVRNSSAVVAFASPMTSAEVVARRRPTAHRT